MRCWCLIRGKYCGVLAFDVGARLLIEGPSRTATGLAG
jgi:hypothetical protein